MVSAWRGRPALLSAGICRPRRALYSEHMRILVDADACPVKGIIGAEAGEVPVLWFATSDHQQADGARWIRVDKGRDAVDHAIFARAAPGDLVVTADHGLASLCLGRGARGLHPDGWEYTEAIMPGLLTERYVAAKARRAGGRTRGPRPRTGEQDAAFRALLRVMLARAD
jgi:uncharacterized protein YaiI (UPF0178 family)